MHRLAGAARCPLPPTASAQASRAAYPRQSGTDGNGCASETQYLAPMRHDCMPRDRHHDKGLDPDERPGGHGKPVALKARQDNLHRPFQRRDRRHNGYPDAQELTTPAA